ncbi:MAG: beta-ketoacyl-ACP synthase II, partial [Chloroflexi bacterium]|nr:beta-ketoacyl-ACP synthase II [Chloroflexota bacterium]
MRDGERRVVVTGMGAVTPLGNDVASFWDGLVDGRSGIGPITVFDPVNVPSKIAGEVRGFDADAIMPKKEVRRNDRYVHFAWAATAEAMRDADLPNPIVDEALAWRTGAIIGSGIGGINTMIRDIIEAHDLGIDRIGPFLVTAMIPDMAAGYIAIYANARGPNYATVSACATSNHAIGDAFHIIRRGEARMMIAGGTEAALTHISFAGYSAARALATEYDSPETASRPFDARRNGFVHGEGAAILVMESLQSARARGAPILAEVLGMGMSSDAHHITAPREDGAGAAKAMGRALRNAGITPDEVDYINAHGTSTPLGDIAETRAIRALFGEHADGLMVSSTKSMLGHSLGATAAVEAGLTVLALHHGIVPPTINLTDP